MLNNMFEIANVLCSEIKQKKSKSRLKEIKTFNKYIISKDNISQKDIDFLSEDDNIEEQDNLVENYIDKSEFIIKDKNFTIVKLKTRGIK